MSTELQIDALQRLQSRAVAGGGFAGQPEGRIRPDATAWAALACLAWGAPAEQSAGALDRLQGSQLADGRVAIAPDYPQAFWPTAEAILAWHGSAPHRQSQEGAVDFLLRTSGKHFKNRTGGIVGHDTTLKGWPWIEGTHSWVEPTAMCLLALEVAGKTEHPRCQEARRMLLDRQLESGGWNYGNTKTYCVELRPSMECTGLALHALAGHVGLGYIQRSIDYLESELPKTRTPLWLAWSVLALSAWGRRPDGVDSAIAECLQRQTDYGHYDTAWISALLVAAKCPDGLVKQLRASVTLREVA